MARKFVLTPLLHGYLKHDFVRARSELVLHFLSLATDYCIHQAAWLIINEDMQVMENDGSTITATVDISVVVDISVAVE